jgi:Mg2+ and Co2+ transporter CorA
VDKIQIEKERKLLYRISDIRDELAMIKSVLTEQGEVWGLFYKNLRESKVAKWDPNIARSANRPQEQIPKFQRRIQKIDEDAQRVEQWIQGQLDLKKTHASLRDSHNSTLLSTAVIGFTVITVIFTPLSFMASLLALPSVDFQTQHGDNKYHRNYLGGFMSKSTHLLMCQR